MKAENIASNKNNSKIISWFIFSMCKKGLLNLFSIHKFQTQLLRLNTDKRMTSSPISKLKSESKTDCNINHYRILYTLSTVSISFQT